VARERVERRVCQTGCGQKKVNNVQGVRAERTHLVRFVEETDRRLFILLLPRVAPPILHPQADFAHVLASDTVTVPADNFNPLPPEREAVVEGDLEFRFTGGTFDG
jgi:hypothetical protein